MTSPVPFFQSAQGDPVRMQRRIAWQTGTGVPVSSGFTDFLSNGGPVAPSPTEIERAVIRNSAMRQAPIQSKMDAVGGPLAMGDLDPANRAQAMLLLSALGKYDTTNPSGAHYRHRLSQAKSSAPTVNKLCLLSDDDLGIPARWTDVMAGGFSIACQNRGNVALTVPIAPGKFDQFGAVSQEAGSGSTLPELRHTWTGNRAASGDYDIYVKVIDDSPLQVKVKVGSASTYDGSTQTLTAGAWNYLTYGATDSVLGSRAEQIQIYWPSSPTLAADDVFKILMRRARWTPSFATARPLAETQARFFIAGTEFTIDGGWTLTHALPGVETLYAPGTAQPIGTFRSGFQDVTLQVQRRMIDYTLQKALLDRDTLSVVLELKNDTLIGATSTNYGIAAVLPACTLIGQGYSVDAGGQNRDETFTFQCKEAASSFSYAGMSFTADCEFVIDTDYATVA